VFQTPSRSEIAPPTSLEDLPAGPTETEPWWSSSTSWTTAVRQDGQRKTSPGRSDWANTTKSNRNSHARPLSDSASCSIDHEPGESRSQIPSYRLMCPELQQMGNACMRGAIPAILYLDVFVSAWNSIYASTPCRAPPFPLSPLHRLPTPAFSYLFPSPANSPIRRGTSQSQCALRPWLLRPYSPSW